MSQNSRKSAIVLTVLGVAVLIGIGWLNSNEKFKVLESRIDQLEADARVLAPLITVMAGASPTPRIPQSYEAIQATGPPNVPEPGGDNALAWCPASENTEAEWLELEYKEPLITKELRIHANFNPGAVVRVLVATDDQEFREVWKKDGTLDVVQAIPISPPAEITRVRLELDTSKVPGWNEIDAVARVDRAGVETWAQGAKASSVWSKASEPLSVR